MNIDVEKSVKSPSISDGFAGSHNQTHPAASMSRIDIDSLSRGDEIRILTESSQYRFSLNDPVRLHGLLTGGRLGEERVEASLYAVWDDNGIQLKYVISAITKGTRIIFSIPAGERNLVTSPVTEFFLIKNRD